MKRFLKCMAVVAGLVAGGVAQAQPWQGVPPKGGQPTLVVNNSGNGKGNTIDVDPKAGEKVVINKSGNGKGNTIDVAPDAGGTVYVNASGNGKGNKIVIEEAPGEHVVIRGSGNGKNNNIVIEKVPGPTQQKPLAAIANKGATATFNHQVASSSQHASVPHGSRR
ncbi:hypothetical protein [Fimbriiglobus ruber]|uniref:hypothetical protein n=1 Tax=Fimbriiglobus ruber TaxID=1908690 RepID=UPI000B4B7BC8|nr:hypothetical protein [Fimbriiglobus ruber]